MSRWSASKDPDEIKDYTFDWTDRLEDPETIVTSTVEVVTGDVAIDSTSENSGVVTVWLSGGTVDGGPQVLLNRVATSAGRTYDQTAQLRMKNH